MASTASETLQSFYSFLGKQLQSESDLPSTPEEALSLWREEQETLAAIREGLADVEAGRTKSLEQFERDFRQRHGIEGTT